VCYHASTTVKEASLNLVARIALSMLPSLCLGFLGILLRAFDIPAALVGLAAGILLTYAFGLGGFAVLLTFVVFGGVVTGLGYRRKAARGIGEPRGGKRTWRSALGNLLVPAMGAVAGIIWPHGLAVFLAVGSLATATFDTVASEVGKAFSSEGVTLHDLKMKPAGSPGGVSVPGTLSGAAAALGVCLVALVFDLVGAEMLIWILMAAFVGTMIESLLKSGCGLRATQTANVINTAAGGSLAVFMAHVLEGK
jgi:uncharacterized protein (TIGR00297 family)